MELSDAEVTVSDATAPPIRDAVRFDSVYKAFIARGRTKTPMLAMEDVSFSASPGEFISLVGPSGCGKSTCLDLLAGLDEPSTGEAELCLAIGKFAHGVSEEDAFSVIGGYTIGSDVTARDMQKSDDGGQWTRGKGFHTFCPIGPWVDTEFDPRDVRVTFSVDGRLRQDGRTRDFIGDIPYLIRYITRFMALEPGDVVMTGTPQGVAPVDVGQTMVAEIEGLGRLENRLVPEPAA